MPAPHQLKQSLPTLSVAEYQLFRNVASTGDYDFAYNTMTAPRGGCVAADFWERILTSGLQIIIYCRIAGVSDATGTPVTDAELCAVDCAMDGAAMESAVRSMRRARNGESPSNAMGALIDSDRMAQSVDKYARPTA